MTRWSLSNRHQKINRRQFIKLATAFQRAIEETSGQPCYLEIRASSDPKLNPVLFNKNAQAMAGRPQDVSRKMWRNADYIDVMVIAHQNGSRETNLVGYAQFKGRFSKRASFQAQHDNVIIQDNLHRLYPKMLTGDGIESNSARTAEMPQFLDIKEPLNQPPMLNSRLNEADEQRMGIKRLRF